MADVQSSYCVIQNRPLEVKTGQYRPGQAANAVVVRVSLFSLRVVGLRLVLLLDLLLNRLGRLRLVRWRSLGVPLLIAAGFALVDDLRGQTDPTVEDHGPRTAVANRRIATTHDHPRSNCLLISSALSNRSGFN